MRKRLIVTGTAAAFVLTAGIVGAVAVQPPGQEDRETSAGPAVPDALQGLPPMMLKRVPVPAENGTVDVHTKSEPQKNLFTYTPAPEPSYTPRHMADPQVDQPTGNFTVAPLPGIDFGQGARPGNPSKPSVQPPTQSPTNPPTQSPRPTPSPTPTPTPTPTPSPSPDPTPTPTPTPTPEPTDPPSEEPTNPPSEEPTTPPSEEPAEEPTPEPTEEPTTEPSTEPSGEPTTEPSPEPSPSN
ncbi:hypothetical protein [Promicromonospora soli]